MSILILGAPEEAHAAFMFEKLQARGGRPVYFDTRRFPSEMRLSLRLGTHAETLGYLQDGPGGEKIDWASVRSVYWRYHMGFQITDTVSEAFVRDMIYREIEATLGSLFRMLPCRWVNSPEAVAMHIYKIHQLQMLQAAGIRIPETLVTNDPDAVADFFERMQGRVIYKPVRGGAHTARLNDADLKPERLKELANAPVQFQELVEGVDVRVYLVGDEVFPGEIRSKTLDFRDDPNAPIVPVDLPESVAADCRTVGRVLGLLYSGIDVRRTPEGEHVFLEGNPAPMFMHFERQTGYPISNRLADLLLAD